MGSRVSLISGLVVAALVGAGSNARACDPAYPPFHQLDPEAQATDHLAPTLMPVATYSVKRGELDGSDCSGLTHMVIGVSAQDEATPADEIGFRLAVEGGHPPKGFSLPTLPIRSYSDGVWIIWTDESPTWPFSFTLGVVAVDLGGNESEQQTIVIQDDAGYGCSVAATAPGAGGLAFLVLAALPAAVRHPRRRSRRSA